LKLIRKEISTLLFSLWTIVWLGVIVIDFFPYSIAHIANLVGIGRGVDLIIYLAIIAIFFFLFKINERQSKIDKKISKIVRQSAKNSIK
jgi:small membrane protein